MADIEETIYLRDASLLDRVAALVAGIATHPDRIAVSTYDDVDDPYHLAIELYATSESQLQDWIGEVRRRFAVTLEVTDAPTGREIDAAAAV